MRLYGFLELAVERYFFFVEILMLEDILNKASNIGLS